MRFHVFLVGVLVAAVGCGKVPATQPDAGDGSGGCTTSAECTDPSKPFCTDSQCVAACHIDDDCAGADAKPYCASDGACVACKTNTECMSNAPVCDATDRICRGCEKDSECASGVCLEAEGTCADASNVLFVMAGGTDTGTHVPDGNAMLYDRLRAVEGDLAAQRHPHPRRDVHDEWGHRDLQHSGGDGRRKRHGR